MKISKIFLAVMAMFVVLGCNPDNGDGGNADKTKWLDEGNICGEWVLTSWSDKGEEAIKVYLVLNEDSSFDLYQRLYSVMWLHYEGSYTLVGNTLSGVYSDGEAWSKQYTVSYAQEPTRIRLVSTTDATDKAIYTEGYVPEHILDQAQPATEVRSVAPERFL